MRIKLKIALVILLSNIACTNNNEYTPPVFMELKAPVGDTLISDIMCSDIISINVVDSILVLHCRNSTDKRNIFLYHKHSGKLLASFGTIGKGPGELHFSFTTSVDINNRLIYARGAGKSTCYNIDSILNNSSANYVSAFKEVKIKHNSNSARQKIVKDDIFLTDGSKQFLLALLTPDGDTISCYKEMAIKDEFDYEEIFIRLYYIYNALTTSKPDGNKLAMATRCGLILEIFDISSGKIEQETIKRYIKPKFKPENPVRNDGKIEGLTYSLCATNKYIYGLWSEDSYVEFPKQLVAFDWEGNSRYRVNFENKFYGFAIDHDDAMMYGVVQDSEGRINLVSYELPKEIREGK